MPLELSPILESELPEFVRVECAAFTASPLTPIMFPRGYTPADQAALLERRMKAFRNPVCTFLKVTDAETGNIVAGGTWHRNGFSSRQEEASQRGEDGVNNKEERKQSEKERNSSSEQRGPADLSAQLKEELFGELDRHRSEFMASKPHFLLGVLVTDPAHARRGAGGMVIGWGVDRADESGVEAYLEATDVGKSLYEKFGFQAILETTVDLTKYGSTGTNTHYCMLRSPKPK